MIKINLVREVRPAARDAAASRPVAGGGGLATATPARDVGSMVLVTLLLAGLLGSAGYWFVKNRTLDRKQREVETARAEAQKLEAIIAEVEEFQRRKDSLEKRIALINQLKQNQKGPVRVMDRVSALLPDLVWLTSMNLTGTNIKVQGKALHPNAFANYVENIKSDPMFDEPVVDAVTQEQVGPPSVYGWGMEFNFKHFQDPAAPAAAGEPAPPAAAAPTGG